MTNGAASESKQEAGNTVNMLGEEVSRKCTSPLSRLPGDTLPCEEELPAAKIHLSQLCLTHRVGEGKEANI